MAGAMSVQNKNPLQVGLLLFLFLNLIGKYAWQGDCQQVGVHHAGIFYEFVPWNGFVEWEIAPCGYWKISADNGSYLEKNRINKDGEIVISSTKTRTQQGNIEDALSKLQTIIDVAAYVPPAPTEAQNKKIAQLSAKSEHKRLQKKKSCHRRSPYVDVKVAGTKTTSRL